MAKTAIILGITGLTGSLLAKELLASQDYDKIIAFSRQKSGLKHVKLTEYIIDLFDLEQQSMRFNADVVFCCIGTTQAKTPDKDLYHKIDYGIPVAAARLCMANDIDTMITISAIGADAQSKIFYNRTKGEMESDVAGLGIKNCYFLQPSLIAGDRDEKRTLETVSKMIMAIINPLLIGGLKKYRSIHPLTIAKAMIQVAKNGYKHVIIPSNEIKAIAHGTT